MRERSEEDYVESNYNGLENIEIHTDKILQLYDEQNHESSLFDELYNTYTKEDVSYEGMSSLIDVNSFMAALITELFSTNFDYPQNNQSFWRETSEGSKWKWILKDLDYTALRRSVDYNMLKYLLFTAEEGSQEYKDAVSIGNHKKTARIYEVMLSFPEFRDRLINNFSIYLGDFLKSDITTRIISEMDAEIQDEIGPTYAAYKDFEQQYGTWRNYEAFDSIKIHMTIIRPQ